MKRSKIFSEGDRLTTLSDLSFFGEACIDGEHAARTATVVVESVVCHILSLSRRDWNDFSEDLGDDVRKQVKDMGEKRKDRDNKRRASMVGVL